MAKGQPSIAKITRPGITGKYERKRLFKLLDSGRKRPVIFIAGPPGSGKTTLISSYLDARKLPCLWYQVDERDEDIATFFYYMGLAAKKAAPRKRKPMPLLTPEYLPGIDVFTKNYFEELYNRLKPPCTVVFDNYQKVHEDSNLHAIICNGLAEIPEGINVVLISRRSSPPAMVCLDVNDKMHMIGWSELQLKPEETGGVLRLHQKKRWKKERVQQIHEASHGWMAGVVLMLRAEERIGQELQSDDKFIPQEIFDYIASESFDRTEKKTQDFLLKSAFLPKMKSSTAIELTGNKQAGKILSRLRRDHYFTERLHQSKAEYQYHPLFRKFLLKRGDESFTKQAIKKLQNTAGRLLEEAGQIEEAAELYTRTGEVQSLIPLILKNAQTLVMQGRNQTVESWLRNIPAQIFDRTPWLIFWMGACKLHFNPPESQRFFENAFELFRKDKDVAGVYLSWCSIVDAVSYEMNDFYQLDDLVSVYRDLISEYPEFPSEDIEHRVSFGMFTCLLLREMNYDQITKWLVKIEKLSEESDDMAFRLKVSSYLCQYYIVMGMPQKARILINRITKLTQISGIPPILFIINKMYEAIYNWVYNEPSNAVKAISKALKKAGSSGVHIFDYPHLGHGVAVAIVMRDYRTAREYLKKMEPAFDKRNNHDVAFYYRVALWERYISGDISTSYEYAQKAMDNISQFGGGPQITDIQISLAYLASAQGDHKRAFKYLDKTQRFIRESKSYFMEYQYLIADAYINLELGREAKALKSIKSALSVAKENGLRYFFFWLPEVMTKLCMKALEHGIEVEHVKEMIKRDNLMPDTPPVEIEDWPWDVKIYTLGRFGIVRDGKPLQFTAKAQKKPLEMLKALIAFGGREVGAYQLTDALWPDADADTAHSAFSSTLNRLRQLIGNKDSIMVRDGRVTLDNRYCWVDVWSFERILGKVKGLWKEGGKQSEIQDRAGLTGKAVSMYRGQFLAGEEQPWAISMRERLRAKALQYLVRLGGHYEKDGECKEAIRCYQKALEVDNLSEECYQELMKCYGGIGRKAEAVSVYRTCRKTLSTVLGIEPSAETERIYRGIAG